MIRPAQVRLTMDSTLHRCPACAAAVELEKTDLTILACPRCSTSVSLTIAKRPEDPSSPPEWLPVRLDGDFLARYVVVRSLGRGASGSVFLAWGRSLKRDVALKLLDLGADRERFHREGRLLSGLCHPNVVVLHEVLEVDGRPCLVTEYVGGGSLRSLLRERGRLSAEQAVSLVSSVLSGLDACHRQGLIHRDLKPENILLGTDGRARIADFGLARTLDAGREPLTLPGTLLGTPRYMAAEQLRGEVVGPQADLYAAGIILYELLTGRPLFDQPGLRELLVAKMVPEPLEDTQTRSGLPAHLVPVLARSLSPDPAARHASAADMASDLARAAASPARAGPTGAASPVGAPDGLLVDGVAGGDLAHFEELVGRYQHQAWRLACAFLSDPTEALDIVQSAFLRVLDHLDAGRSVRHFPAFLRTVVTHLCQDHLEKKAPEYKGDLADVPAEVSSVVSKLRRKERNAQLHGALSMLPASQRIAAVLRYFEELSTREIAEAMELTPKAVERLLARARQGLAAILAPD